MKYFNLENLGIFLLFLASLLFIFSPTLIGGRIIFEHGVLSFHHPAYAFLSRALKTPNMSFLWSAAHLSGFPIYLSQVGFFHPFNILYKFFDSFTLYGWLVFLNFFLGLIVTYILARNFKLSKISSLLVAFAYVFSHSYLNMGQLNIFANLIPIFPLIILSIIKISQKKLAFILIGILALTIGWLSSDIQSVFYVAIMAFLLSFFFDIKEYNSQIGFFRNFPTTKKFLFLLIISLVLISFWLLPSLQFIELSTRGVNFQLAKQSTDIGTFVRFFYPHFYFRYFTDRATLFIGVLPFLLAIASFFLPQKNRLIKFFIFLIILVFLLSFKYSPLAWLSYYLPLFNLFRLQQKWWLIGDFILIILAALTLDSLERFREHLRFKKYIKILKIFAVIILILTAVVNFIIFFFRSQLVSLATWFFDKYLYFKTTQAPLEQYHQIIREIFDETAQTLSLANPKFLIALIFTLISLAFLVFYQRGKFKLLIKHFKIIALIIIILNLLLIWKIDDVVRVTVPKKTLVEPPPVAHFLQDQKAENEPFRIHRFMPHLRPVEYIELGLNDLRMNYDLSQQFDFETLRPNINIIYNLDSIEAHEHFITKRHLEILQLLGASSIFLTGVEYNLWDELSKNPSLTLQERFQIFQSEKNQALLSMMNVKYVISPFEFPPPWEKVFETLIEEEESGDSVLVYIYENPGVLPRVYFADKVKFIEPNNEKVFDSLMEITDFKKETLIECLNCGQRLGMVSKKSLKDKIIIEEIKDGYLKLKTKTVSPRWLIWSESNLPTWEVRISGQLTNTYTANYLYQSILVPKGENEIEFKYPGVLKQFSYSVKKLLNKL